MSAEWARLAAGRYLNLETYRRDGAPVRTPLWFAAPTGAAAPLYAYTIDGSGKVKRLRRDARCRVAACDMRGRLSGPWLDAHATLAGDAEHALGMRLLDAKYWPWKQLLGLTSRLRPARPRVVIAIRPAER